MASMVTAVAESSVFTSAGEPASSEALLVAVRLRPPLPREFLSPHVRARRPIAACAARCWRFVALT